MSSASQIYYSLPKVMHSLIRRARSISLKSLLNFSLDVSSSAIISSTSLRRLIKYSFYSPLLLSIDTSLSSS